MQQNGNSSKPENLFIGIDSGSTSVRGAIFASTGVLLKTKSILVSSANNEQDCDEIWSAVCAITRFLTAGFDPSRVKGISFDGTCSLVTLDKNYAPLAKIIMWMDHKAVNEAKELSESNHQVLLQCGGKISPEMSVAKVCYLYRNHRSLYDEAAHFVELPDWMMFKATGTIDNFIPRSLNSLVCKWGYDSGGRRWYDDFWMTIFSSQELNVLYDKIGACKGSPVRNPGEMDSRGLSETGAHDLGLIAGTAVGGALIDAYAGALGTIGIDLKSPDQLESRLAIIAGTSSCHIALTKEAVERNGVWGPYKDVLLPGFSCLEGGQSFTGKAVEIFLLHHPYYYTLGLKGVALFEKLDQLVANLGADAVCKTKNVHILPDVHGNRCPLADPEVNGSWIGISTYDEESFVILYLSLLLAISFSTRDIIEAMKQPITELYISGGLSSNQVWLQILADVTKSTVFTGRCDEPVLLGSAICAKSAHDGTTLFDNMRNMTRAENVYHPCGRNEAFLNQKFKVFKELFLDQDKYRNIMA